jgi:hypothetical protein
MINPAMLNPALMGQMMNPAMMPADDEPRPMMSPASMMNPAR